ncbi:MAG: hypothetical protein JO110_19555, partial [Acetobacteraceae bacterium]|nr:hypothetical protein [Acetobacteraceae bacterium]
MEFLYDNVRNRRFDLHSQNRGQTSAYRIGSVRGGEFDLYFLDPGVEIRDLPAQQTAMSLASGEMVASCAMAVSNGPTLAG